MTHLQASPISRFSRLALLAPSLAMLAFCSLAQAQNTATDKPVNDPSAASSSTTPKLASPKKWSVYWGWNRSNYSNSEIQFWGADHNFVIRNVQASDLQTDVTVQNIGGIYLNPGQITIPQTNLRLAYQWSDDVAIALNLDHMKYVMIQDQSVPISGQIKGVAQSGNQVLTEPFLTFEHTDGLNIVSLEIEKQRKVDWFGKNFPTKVFALAGAGIVLPKSNVTLGFVGRVRNDEFHFAGYSVGLGAGLEVDLYKDVFFRTAYKMGWVNLPDVLTSAQGDKAAHRFSYNEWLIAVGFRF